jgi:hypothetical protein
MDEKKFMFLLRNVIRLSMKLYLLYLFYSVVSPSGDKSVAFISQFASIMLSIPILIALLFMREKRFSKVE